MNHLSLLVAGLCVPILATSCTIPPAEPETRTIASVSPYSSLSDRELNTRYLALLLELQTLNEEMAEANNRKDFEAVNAKARVGLSKAYEARDLAKHLDDPADRSKRLDGITKIITDLEKLVQMTS